MYISEKGKGVIRKLVRGLVGKEEILVRDLKDLKVLLVVLEEREGVCFFIYNFKEYFGLC